MGWGVGCGDLRLLNAGWGPYGWGLGTVHGASKVILSLTSLSIHNK